MSKTTTDPALFRDPGHVQAMFDSIAERYDLTNRVMTFGLDQRWRKRAAAATAGGPGAPVLDCATGTGRLADALRGRGGPVVGLDFSAEMLVRARERLPEDPFVRGDVTSLPFGDAAFAGVTIGFGLRNVADPNAGLAEMARVVRPGGRVVVLEAVQATGPFARFYGWVVDLWARVALPRLSRRLGSNRDAYRYLTSTMRSYATAPDIAGWMRSMGLVDVVVRKLLPGGTVVLVVATVPPAS